MEIIQSSITITLLIGILFLCLQWLFIYSAVKAATKKATIEAYKEIEKLKTIPQVTAEEEFQKEMDGWK